jgi:hypothetical protein
MRQHSPREQIRFRMRNVLQQGLAATADGGNVGAGRCGRRWEWGARRRTDARNGNV